MSVQQVNYSEDLAVLSSRKSRESQYWLDKFSDHQVKSGFSTDLRVKQTGKTVREEVSFTIEAGLPERLMQLSKGSDYTLNVILQAVLIGLLHKYAGLKDITVGSPIYRQKTEGEYLNTVLALRNRVHGDMSFKELLIQARRTLKEAVENQNYPIDILVYKLGLPESDDGFPLFDTGVLLENIHDPEYIRHVPLNMLFAFRGSGERVDYRIIYHAHRYKRTTVERIGGYFNNLLAAALMDPERRLRDLDILDGAEKERLIKEFNGISRDYPEDRTIYHFVEDRAEQEPGRLAVEFETTRLTYRELNDGVNRLALYLKRFDIKRDQTVGILLERSHWMLTAILATWKLGAAYIPIDPGYPILRTAGILNDSSSPLVILQSPEEGKALADSYDGQIETLETIAPYLQSEGASTLDFRGPEAPHGLAYVIYTSGSTGKPKGAMIEHSGMMNHMQAKVNDLNITAESIICQNASHTFDISVWQFFAALLTGGKTVIYPNSLVLDPTRLVSRVIDDRLTILEVVPSYLAVMLDILDPRQDRLHLEYLMVTGEEVKANLVKRWFEKYPSIKMVNAYGPTEASDDITHFTMNRAPAEESIPIGKPLQNLTIYIVDEYMNFCPIGVKGEICVAGIGVGRGYLNNPELTEDKFKDIRRSGPADPSPNGGRLYRTGDLGRWRADGVIEFFGRKDHQVKIRGYRIEMGEIESQLAGHPEVKQAVVVKIEKNQSTYLCGYLTARKQLNITEIKSYLGNRLPDYMVPDYINQLEELPVTPNGKIDRKALAALDISIDMTWAGPENETQETLAGIWAEVLGIEKNNIGIDSNFFDQGGHSLNATILVSKIHKALDVKIPLAEVFKRPTIKQLADYLQGMEKDKFIVIEPAEEREYYTLSSAQQRLYVLQQMDEQSVAYNIPMAVSLEEPVDRRKLENAVKKLVRRHESFRTTFEWVNGEPVQRVRGRSDSAVQYVELTPGAEPGSLDRQIRQAVVEFIRPFDLTRGPLLRVGLIHAGEPGVQDILMVDMHHIISDGVSMDIVVREFWALYAGRELEPLKLQYKDYSRWQNQPRQREMMKKQEQYWQSQFKDDIAILELPLDNQRTDQLNFEGESLAFEIDGPVAERVKEFISAKGVTLNIFLLAVYNVLLAKFTGQEDILVGTVVSGRMHADLQPIVGFFVNMLALRNRPTGDKTFDEFLEEVKENALAAYENQDYPFEKLVEKLEFPREAGRHPMNDAVFVFLADEGKDADMPNAREELKQNPYGISHFDLMFNVTETAGTASVTIEYSKTLFKPDTISELAECYTAVLEQVVENDGARLSEIEMNHGFVTVESNVLSEEDTGFDF